MIDLYAKEDVLITQHDMKKIELQDGLNVPDGSIALIKLSDRLGISSRLSLHKTCAFGLEFVDSLPVLSHSKDWVKITEGEIVGHAVILKVKT